MEQRYFIAIIPPDDIANKVTSIKKEVEEKYQSKAALRSPAHITLHMPFLWKEEKESKLIDTLKSFQFDVGINEIKLKGFDKFGDRVIFIHADNNQCLADLQQHLVWFCKQNLQLFNQADDMRGFHPHVTIAFRDLRKKHFNAAWQDFSNKAFEASFPIEGFSLLKHDGKQWNVLCNFRLR